MKNAARRHELKHTHVRDTQLKTTFQLHTFFEEHLRVPTKDLFQKVKKGRGIYRRHFEYIPAHGPGCVDHNQDECQKLDNSSKMHHIRTTCESTEEVGVLECRTRSCHQCEHCWKPSGDWGMCENLEIVGKPEMEYLRPPTHYEQRVLRSHSSLKQQGIEMAKTLQKGSIVALEIDDSKLGNYTFHVLPQCH
jgi:hypothetical protein